MNAALGALLAQLGMTGDVGVSLPEPTLDADLARQIALAMIGRTIPAPPPADAVLDEIGELHRREASGEVVSAADWRAVRHRAIALSDSPSAAVRRAGSVAEAAAWSLGTGQAGLTDTLMALRPVVQSRASAATGWTNEEQVLAEAKLLAIAGQGVDRSAIPSHFAASEPRLASRFVKQLDASNAAVLGLTDEIRALIHQLSAKLADEVGMPDPL